MTMNQGWVCPLCNRVNAPIVLFCPCSVKAHVDEAMGDALDEALDRPPEERKSYGRLLRPTQSRDTLSHTHHHTHTVMGV